MPYKTIVLKLLRQFPALHFKIRSERQLLAALEAYSMTLRRRTEELKNQFSATNPESSPEQSASAALEVAMEELTNQLAEAPLQDSDSLTLEAAIASVRSSPTE